MSDTRPIDILVEYLNKTHQIKVSWRPDLPTSVSPVGLDGARWGYDGRHWTIPAMTGHALLPCFREHFPSMRVSFDKACAGLIAEQLQREAATAELSTATNGDVPDVLSIKLRDFQRAASAYCLRGTPRKIIALDAGLGKTAVACTVARIKQSRTLWITRASLVETLLREIKKLTSQNAINLLGSSPTAESIRIITDKRIQHVVISYTTLARSLEQDKNEDGEVTLSTSMWGLALAAADFDMCIADEVHTIRNRSTSAWKVVNMLSSIPSWLGLTATPLVNSGLDFHSILSILDKQTFGSPQEFVRAYLSADGKRVLNPKRMQHDLMPYVFIRRKKDVMKDLPAKIRQHHYITLSSEWDRKYRQVLRGLYEKLDGSITDIPPFVLAEINRSRQIAAQGKVEHTVELARDLEEQGSKTLVFTCWRESADMLTQELFCEQINGDTPQAERLKICDRFNNDPHRKHLVLMLQVGGTGLNLTGADAVLFNDASWTHADHSQAEDRAYGRLNDPHGCMVYYVQVKNSVDEHMFGIIESKQMLDEQGVEGVRRFAAESVSLKHEYIRYLKTNGV